MRNFKFKDSWKGYDLPRGNCSNDFKQYLRDRGMYFEPSSNGSYIHFEVKNADESCDLEVKAILKHYKSLKDSGDMTDTALIYLLNKELRELYIEATNFFDEHYIDEKDAFDTKENAKIMDDYCIKCTALYYTIKAYGSTPKTGYGTLDLIDKGYLDLID